MNSFINSRFIRALNRQPVDRTPVWIMRQAGRYMPEYMAVRNKAGDFLTLCKTPELASQVTLLPIQKFKQLDAAILFSDILIIPDAMGLGLRFVAEEGPKFSKVIATANDVINLPHIDPERDLNYVTETIRMLVPELAGKTPLIGFTGSPWTLATYMVEGQTSKQFNHVKAFMYQDPETMHKLLSHLSIQIRNVLQAQIDAGVNAVMIFDTWGGVLTDSLYKEFSLQYMAQIVQDLRIKNPSIPSIIFTKNAGRCLEAQAAIGCSALGLDWNVDLNLARRLVGDKVALQGNLDPCVLYASANRIEAEVKNVLQQYGAGAGHIFNLGHGIPPDVDPENVQSMLNAIEAFSPAFHQSLLAV